MRIVAIVGGLVLGLLGLFMSVCGGGLLVSLGYSTLSDLFGPHRDPGAFNGLFLLVLPAGFLTMGIVVCRVAYHLLSKRLKDK
jgi:hypothetical protein